MNTSDNGLEFVTREEGEVLHPYKDQVGLLTIGVGHLIRAGETFPAVITHQQAIDLLRNDIKSAENAVNSHVTVELNQNQFDACVSFTFNVGNGAFASSTLCKLINAGDFAGASLEFLKWDKAGGKPNPVLTGRRHREIALFQTPVGQTVFVEQNDVETKVNPS